MQQYTKVELSVGLFIVAGTVALGYLALTLGGLRLHGHARQLHTRFASVGELKVGAPVKIAGVSIGEVKRIQLINFAAEVELTLDDKIELPDDTIASIESAGLLGDAYIALSPGASDRTLGSGARIARTEPATSLMDLIEKYAFGSPLSEDDKRPSEGAARPGKSPASDGLE